MNAQNDALILIVADEPDLRREMTDTLASSGYQTAEAWSVCEAARAVEPAEVRIVLYVPAVSEISATEAVAKVRSFWPTAGLIVVTASDQANYQTEALNSGAFDVLTMPVAENRLLTSVRRVLIELSEQRELLALRENIAMNYGFDNIIGDSREMAGVREMIRRVAATDISVLITGPDGVGKDLVARVLHFHSERRRKPIITVDFSATPEAHQETELFGTVNDGQRIPGALERAHGGTLLLKEPLKAASHVQRKLADFLKDKTLSEMTDGLRQSLDLRVVTVSSANLPRATSDKQFLDELYYLLGEVLITVPSLNMRKDDVADLTAYFMHRLGADAGKSELSLTPEALEKLMTHYWPGNVSELRNVIKRAIAFCDDGVIDAGHILFTTDTPIPVESGKRTLTIKGKRLDLTQRSVIVQALNDNDWNFTRTASELGIGRTTLWRKVKKYNLKREPAAAD